MPKKIFFIKQKEQILREHQRKQKSKGKRHRETFLFTTDNIIGYSQNDKNRPIRFRDKNTYKITQSRNRFNIYRLDRKEKPKKIKTVRKSKNNRNKDEVAKNFQSKKLKLTSTLETNPNFRSGKINTVQSNTRPSKRKKFQMVALVDVTDTRRNITDRYLAFSNRIINNNSSKAFVEMEKMASAKFIKEHGYPRKTEDIIANVDEDSIRYQYWTYKEKF